MTPDSVPFGRYKLLNLLGEGGMAKVYRALLSGPMGFEKEVALKRLDSKVTADERVVKALINEARLGGQLKHKNIVEIYEFNHVDGHYFMAMEYVDGWTLDALIRRSRSRREPLPASVIYEIVSNICRGLEYAHGLSDKSGRLLNLVHRDLKPGNVMISRDGDVKLMDFGIAKADTNLYKTTAADVTKGTPVYMSPEQVTGGKLDQRSDIFSLGSILVEMITGEIPFSADNLLAIMHAVLNADIARSMAAIEDRIPVFGPFVRKAMAKERELRFDSASEMARELRVVRHSLPPGPTLLEWLEDNMIHLPPATTTGEFGPDGAPRPVSPRGTESLAAVAAFNQEAAELSVRLSGGGERPGPPRESPGESGAETQVAPSARVRSNEPMGPMTAEFFEADGRGAEVGATRLQAPTTSESGRKTRRPLDASSRRRSRAKRKKTQSRAVLAAVLVASAALAVMGVALFVTRGDSAGDAEPLAQAAGPVQEATPEIASTPAPELTPSVTPAPPRAARPRPSREATPRPRENPTPPPLRTPEPTPPPARTPPPKPRATPAPVTVVGTGVVHLNSKPWAKLVLDGKDFGQTPRKNVSIPAGKHTIRFECANCDPSESQTFTFTLEPGGTFKKIIKFGE